MNYQSEFPSQRLTLITKNGSIHLGWVEDTLPQPSPTKTIQLELDFNQGDTQWH